MIVFFFSSRRRHTRFDCDWSSDVCSSDLSCVTWADEHEAWLRFARETRGFEHYLRRLRGIKERRDEAFARSEEHTSELQSQSNLVCRLLLEKKKQSDHIILPTQKHPLISI